MLRHIYDYKPFEGESISMTEQPNKRLFQPQDNSHRQQPPQQKSNSIINQNLSSGLDNTQQLSQSAQQYKSCVIDEDPWADAPKHNPFMSGDMCSNGYAMQYDSNQTQ